MAKAPKPCQVAGCEYPKKRNKHRCVWHWLMAQPIDTQVAAALHRRAAYEGEVRQRVPSHEWPPGERWCSGCQCFVPMFYVMGSRCKACESRAGHKAHIEKTYRISYEEYEALLAWQDGRCYICGRVPRVRRLSVDHNHQTDEVRGLLCSDDEWGCNVSLRRILGDLGAAERLLDYVQRPPIQRMRAGEEGPLDPHRVQSIKISSEPAPVRPSEPSTPSDGAPLPDWWS